jgi:hypothetical protein
LLSLSQAQWTRHARQPLRLEYVEFVITA